MTIMLMTQLTPVRHPRVAREVPRPCKAHAAMLTLKRSLVLVATARRQMDVLYVLDKELVEQEHLAALSARVLFCAAVALTSALATLLARVGSAANSFITFRRAACLVSFKLTHG